MDINDWRGIATILCMAAFMGVVWWAYGPSRKKYFDRAAQIPFEEDETGGESKEDSK